MTRRKQHSRRARPPAVCARVLIALAAVLALALPALAGGGPSETVVLVNDASDDSVRVAGAYVRARGIPPTNVVHVSASTDATVPVRDFVRDVVDPLRAHLARHGLEDRVRFLVLTQGLPIRSRVAGGFVSTAAALTVLDTPLCGSPQERSPRIRNPYRSGVAPRRDSGLGGRLILTTALISSTADEALALIERSIASDGTAPAGARFVFQDARGNAANRNPAYDAARARLEELGHGTEHVGAGGDVVRGRTAVMGYMSGGSYSALSVAGVTDNAYLPGALCDMLQSYGAVPANFVPGEKGSQFPVTHMIRAGVTGVHGAVAEPYNVAFPTADLFLPYTRGFALAETFHQTLPLRYWMNLVIGDPLCAPYAKRPVVEVDGAPDGQWSGPVPLRARAAGAVRMALFVDGVPVAANEGEELAHTLDTTALAGGEHHVLFEAVGPGEAEPCGWHVLRPTTADPGSEAAPPATDKPPAPPGLVLTAPAEVRAGEELTLTVSPDTPGAAVRGAVWIVSDDPPVRWTRHGRADGTPATLSVSRAAKLVFRARLPGTSDEPGTLSNAVTVNVLPAAAAHYTTPLSRAPLRQVFDMPVHAVDRFGNVCTDHDGEVVLVAPGNPGATTASAPLRNGRATLRDVILTRDGPRVLRFDDKDGKRRSADGEGVRVGQAAVRAWLRAPIVAAADAKAAWEATQRDFGGRHGDVTDLGPFLRVRTGGDEIKSSRPGEQDGDVVCAVTFVHALSAVEVEVRGAARGRLRVTLGGKELHDGPVPKGDPARLKKYQPLGSVRLGRGVHRLTVVAERRGRLSFGVAATAPSSPGSVWITADDGTADRAADVSGTVRTGGRPESGTEVVLRTGGATRSTRTAADGSFGFADVPHGEHVLACNGAEQTVHVDGANVTGVRLSVRDTTPPTVDVARDDVPLRAAKTLVVDAAVGDAGGIASAWVVVGEGEPVARLTKGPWRFEVDVSDLPRGKTTVTVVAQDSSGNEARSEPRDTRLIEDSDGPRLKVAGLRSGAVLSEPATLEVTATDPIGVASVHGRVTTLEDGSVLLVFERTKPVSDTWEGALLPNGIEPGRHELLIVATDIDGNTSSRRLRFRVK